MQTLITTAEMRTTIDQWHASGMRTAFVPTMGALHAGHISLVKQAQATAQRVVVSIFVNPKQFGPKEDFSRYPRTIKDDLALLSSVGVNAVFLPNTAEIYPENFQTYVFNNKIADDLCGKSRPGHFQGVLTVVIKLLNMVQPSVAIFGKKDFQQWRLIERMIVDLSLPFEIMGGEILRETNGLAMSSRNRYLTPEMRALAPKIYAGLDKTRNLFKGGQKNVPALVETFMSELQATPQFAVEYVEVRRVADLSPFAGEIDAPAVMLVATRLGDVRLIDNVEF